MYNVVGGKIWNSIKSWSFLEKERTEFGDLILIIKLHKDSSIFRVRIRDSISKLRKALFGKLFLVNSEKFLWSKIVFKTVRFGEETDVWKKLNESKGFIQLDHKWQYRKYPNLLLAGMWTGKSKSSLWNGL